jgi:transcription antitermination factor NusG
LGAVVQAAVKPAELSPKVECAEWFAIHTYARHEKRVASQVALKRIDHYLPMVARLHQWSDRRKEVHLPLFPCYMFVRVAPSPERLVQVLQVPGVIRFVGQGREPVPIPDNQIGDIQKLIASKLALDPYPFLKVGQRVRIRSGPLEGVEGILVRRNGARRLVISVDSLQRSLSVCLEGFEVEAI